MRRCVPLFAGCALLACPLSASAQDSDWNRYTLEGLEGVHIRIEVDDTCGAAGVSASDFEASTSLQLIESEVGVLTYEQMLANLALPELLVSVACAESAAQLAYAVGLRVQQATQLLRNTQITLPETVTWHATEVGLTSKAGAGAAVGETLTDELTAFAEAWKAANPDDEG